MAAPTPTMVSAGLHAVTTIENRRDFLRWQHRTKHHRRFLFYSYLIGSAVGAAFSAVFVFELEKQGDSPMPIAGMIALFIVMGIIAWGPIVWLACLWLYVRGAARYKQVFAALESCGRVCATCEAVAFFEGEKLIFPKEMNGLILSPKMLVDLGDDCGPVICETCHAALLAEIGQA